MVDEPMIHQVATIVSTADLEQSNGDALRWHTGRIARELADKPGITLERIEPWQCFGKRAGVQVTLTNYPGEIALRLLKKHPDRYRQYTG